MDFNRESFIFHKDWYNALSQLNNDLRLELYDAIMRKAFYSEPPSLSPIGQMAMSFIEPQIERDFDRWLDIREKRSSAGKAHKGNQYTKKEQTEHEETNETNVPSVPSVPTLEQMEQVGTNGSVSVSVSVDNNSVILKEKDSKEKEIKEFVERIYKMYPTRCPIRDNISLGKCAKDKKRIEGLLKRYSMEDIERVVKKEIEDKLGKHPLKNFSTFLNNFPDPTDMFSKQNLCYPQSIDDVKADDVQPTLTYFIPWMNKVTPKVCDGLVGGYPENEEQYQHLINHTIGGSRALCYVVLVFQRDGWSEYYDERGFMFTYSNYIKANGLFKE